MKKVSSYSHNNSLEICFSSVEQMPEAKGAALFITDSSKVFKEQAHELRLYYKWNRKDDIGSIVEDLNHFNHVNLAVEGDRLIVKP